MRWQLLVVQACVVIILSLFSRPSITAAEPATVASGRTVRIATYNVSLYGRTPDELLPRLTSGKDPQAIALASVIQTVRPDILLLNEIDYSEDAAAAKLFAKHYLAISQNELAPIEYPHIYAAPSNTGVDSSLDLNANGKLGEADDAWGYGTYPGQYAFAILSRYPIDHATIRTFQLLRWSQLPGALQPLWPLSQLPYYPSAVWKQLRLSSKNHVDVSIDVEGQRVHLLASHPTPPVFDGPEDRNGCRNHNEILFWKHYLDHAATDQASFQLKDDQGRAGGLDTAAHFVILGDLNSDISFGDSRASALRALMAHPRIHDPKPRRSGMPHDKPDDMALDTAAFAAGQARVDYVLPSTSLQVSKSEVFWPAVGDRQEAWIHASDHRMVWVDVILPPSSNPSSTPPTSSP